MAAKKKKARKAKKTRKPAKRKAAKRKAAPRRKKRAAPRAKKLAQALAPSMDRLRTGASEMGQGMMESGRVIIGEAKEAGKEAQEKVKDTVTDWWNRPS